MLLTIPSEASYRVGNLSIALLLRGSLLLPCEPLLIIAKEPYPLRRLGVFLASCTKAYVKMKRAFLELLQ